MSDKKIPADLISALITKDYGPCNWPGWKPICDQYKAKGMTNNLSLAKAFRDTNAPKNGKPGSPLWTGYLQWLKQVSPTTRVPGIDAPRAVPSPPISRKMPSLMPTSAMPYVPQPMLAAPAARRNCKDHKTDRDCLASGCHWQVDKKGARAGKGYCRAKTTTTTTTGSLALPLGLPLALPTGFSNKISQTGDLEDLIQQRPDAYVPRRLREAKPLLLTQRRQSPQQLRQRGSTAARDFLPDSPRPGDQNRGVAWPGLPPGYTSSRTTPAFGRRKALRPKVQQLSDDDRQPVRRQMATQLVRRQAPAPRISREAQIPSWARSQAPRQQQRQQQQQQQQSWPDDI